MPGEKIDKVLDILLDEYQRNANYTHQMESQIEKISSIWITLVALTFGFGLKENIPVIFFLLPVLISTVLLYSACLFEVVIIAGGYTASLEIKINEHIGTSVLCWESEMALKVNHLRISLIIVLVVGFLSSLGIVIYSIYRSFYYYPKLVWVQIAFVCIASPLIVWLFMRLPFLHKRVSGIATKIIAG
jgi:hypothetical protein